MLVCIAAGLVGWRYEICNKVSGLPTCRTCIQDELRQRRAALTGCCRVGTCCCTKSGCALAVAYCCVGGVAVTIGGAAPASPGLIEDGGGTPGPAGLPTGSSGAGSCWAGNGCELLWPALLDCNHHKHLPLLYRNHQNEDLRFHTYIHNAHFQLLALVVLVVQMGKCVDRVVLGWEDEVPAVITNRYSAEGRLQSRTFHELGERLQRLQTSSK